MDFKDEYKRAAKWCRDNLDFDRDGKFNTFETTIRVLGGLLAAHYLTSVSEDASIRADAPFYLERATDLGDRLLGAFNSPSGLPYSGINLHTREGVPDRDNHGLVSLAEAATLQLELKYLSHLTDDPIYWRKAERVSVGFYNIVGMRSTDTRRLAKLSAARSTARVLRPSSFLPRLAHLSHRIFVSDPAATRTMSTS